jgi:hypothetical protein
MVLLVCRLVITMNRAAPTHVATTGGKKAASDLPTRTSKSLAGVARSGSRLRSTFSPTKE